MSLFTRKVLAAAISDDVTVDGQEEWITAGTYSWTCPDDVYSVCAVCIGGGGGGGNSSARDGGAGGGLGYTNNIAVTPGNSYDVEVGVGGSPGGGDGGDSYFKDTSTCQGEGGDGDATWAGGSYTGDGGGTGGDGGNSHNDSGYLRGGGGGGAGGYTAKGGIGGGFNSGAATDGGGGGGGGGGKASSSGTNHFSGGNGGGTGIYGKGANGVKGASGYNQAGNGTAGSGGEGQEYGGAGGVSNGGRLGKVGAVRIIWGAGRSFPDTRTVDLGPAFHLREAYDTSSSPIGTSYTREVPFGTEAAVGETRMIAITFSCLLDGVYTGTPTVTIGGVTATVNKRTKDASNFTALTLVAHAAVPTGTEGDAVIDWGVSTERFGAAIATYRFVEFNTTAIEVDDKGGSVSPKESTMIEPQNHARSVVLVAIQSRNTTGHSLTATGGTLTTVINEDLGSDEVAYSAYIHSTDAAADQVISYSFSASTHIVMVCVAFAIN